MATELFRQLIAAESLDGQRVVVSGDLLLSSLLLSLGWFLASLVCCRTAFQAIVDRLAVRMEQLAVHFMELLTYIVFVAMGSAVVLKSKCLWDAACCFDTEPSVHLDVALLYCIQIAGYVNMTLFRFAVPRLYGPGGPDLTVDTIIHHLVTLLLLAGSWLEGYTTIGCVVLFLHDPSSIWLKATRILERAKGEASAKPFFVAFAVVFFVFRIVGMPFLVGRPILLYAPNRLEKNVLGTLLGVLYLMNLVWFYKILEIMFRLRARKEDTTPLIECLPKPVPKMVVNGENSDAY